MLTKTVCSILFFLFYGSENTYSKLKPLLLIKFISLNNSSFSHLIFIGSIHEHIASRQSLGKWETQVESQALASIAQIPIYVLTKGTTEVAEYK